MKSKHPRIQTAAGRGVVEHIEGRWAYVKYPNGAQQKHHVAALTPKDRSIRRNAIIQKAKDDVARQECEEFLAANPGAWQSEPARRYD